MSVLFGTIGIVSGALLLFVWCCCLSFICYRFHVKLRRMEYVISMITPETASRFKEQGTSVIINDNDWYDAFERSDVE